MTTWLVIGILIGLALAVPAFVIVIRGRQKPRKGP